MYLDVTKSESQILIPYIDDKNSTEYSRYKTLSSGVVVSASNIYAISDGVVVFIGTSEHQLYNIIVQANVTQCLCYCLLTDVDVSVNTTVSYGTKLGSCKGKFRFEYATYDRGLSPWAIRLPQLTFYKQNPTDILLGNVSINAKNIVESGYNTQTVFRSTP